MTNFQPGEIVMLRFPLVTGGPGKLRPALVIADTGDDDVLVARITTQAHPSNFDIDLLDWKAANLLAPSVARVHKLATVEKPSVVRSVGHLTASDRQRVGAKLEDLVAGW